MVQVPELDVTIAGGYKVGAVVGEGDGRHLAGHLVGSYHHILLLNTNRKHTACLQGQTEGPTYKLYISFVKKNN